MPAGQTLSSKSSCVSWTNDVTFLSLTFLICQMEVSGLETVRDNVSIKLVDAP